jgi:hypothetical protein
MDDPRAQNCRAFRVDAAGKVIGVELEYVPVPSARYELIQVVLIDETEAAGQTVANFTVLDKNGVQAYERVWLAWPWPTMTDRSLPGNPNSQHMITNGYNPPDRGPLAMYVGDTGGNTISDMVGGLGLPFNRHVCYYMTWRERGSVEPDPEPEPEPNGDYGAVLERIASALERLTTHLGA